MSFGIDLARPLRFLPGPAAPAIDPGALRRLLIVKTSSIGDVVHALPVASALVDRYPALRITWVIEDAYAPLVTGHRAIDRIVRWPRMSASRMLSRDAGLRSDLRSAIASLRKDRYDLALDLQGLARSAWISLLSRAPLRLGVAGQREGSHLVAFGVPPRGKSRHAVDRYLAAAWHLGAVPGPARFDLPVTAADVSLVAARLPPADTSSKGRIVALTPSASSSRKSPPPPLWREVAAALSGAATVVLIGHESQRVSHRRIAAGLDCLDWTGETTVGEAVALLARADLHIAPDSGPLHVSAALGRPTIGLFGPTDPDRTGPHGQLGDVIARSAICGAACWVACRSAARCLAAIDPREVIRQARRVLDRATA